MPGYYDIDEILAEEVYVPCKTLFDFSYLGHLDPENEIPNNDTTTGNNYDVLKEGSRINMPVWAIRKWSDLNFVQLGFPKQYRLKARERLEADPTNAVGLGSTTSGTMTTSSNNNRFVRYFESGKVVTDLIDTSCTTVTKALRASGTRVDRERAKRLLEINALQQQSHQVRSTLLSIYKGQRLSQTLDWSLSCSGDDDVTTYTSKLTSMEQRLFRTGAIAAMNHQLWKIYNNPRLLPSTSAQRSSKSGLNKNSSLRVVTPDVDRTTYSTKTNATTTGSSLEEERMTKRIRSH